MCYQTVNWKWGLVCYRLAERYRCIIIPVMKILSLQKLQKFSCSLVLGIFDVCFGGSLCVESHTLLSPLTMASLCFRVGNLLSLSMLKPSASLQDYNLSMNLRYCLRFTRKLKSSTRTHGQILLSVCLSLGARSFGANICCLLRC